MKCSRRLTGGEARLTERVFRAARSFARGLLAFALLALASFPAIAQVNVLTHHNDIARTGAEHQRDDPHARQRQPNDLRQALLLHDRRLRLRPTALLRQPHHGRRNRAGRHDSQRLLYRDRKRFRLRLRRRFQRRRQRKSSLARIADRCRPRRRFGRNAHAQHRRRNHRHRSADWHYGHTRSSIPPRTRCTSSRSPSSSARRSSSVFTRSTSPPG